MPDIIQIESLIHQHGFDDFKWLDPKDIVVARWVRLKCEYGCPDYGRLASCPPNAPSVEDCQRFFSEYAHAIAFHFQKVCPDDKQRKTWYARTNLKLVKLEQAIFMAGHPKAFVTFIDSCGICPEGVPDRADCKKSKLARPAIEAMAVDVYSTVRKLGYPIQVLTDINQAMNRYAFLMVD